ncbi:paralemmin 1a [Nerophis ophidion]|uniref:paralemmin 1a n=1 Tax=Nerophis ophidion TaxID=159077 RepID=UPI002ADF3252|nr:paralemmin 1a [Nerophis ophidion]
MMSQEDRKWQSELEQKKRQLDDDRRALQHAKSKALRERWLLDGAPSVGDDQKQQHEEHARNLEDTVSRLEKELMNLESSGACTSVTHTSVTSGSIQEVRVHQAGDDDIMKRAMYSVEIKVERDKATGETRVLSSHTKLPVDCSQGGVKVYEDEQKVVHEVNGENDVHLLSAAEVEELILKADEALTPPHEEEEEEEKATQKVNEEDEAAEEIIGLEATPPQKSSGEEPVTLTFMGYQDVEDQDHAKKVLGLQGTVKAELVRIEDGKTSPPGGATDAPPASAATAEVADKQEAAAESAARGAVKPEKEKRAYATSPMSRPRWRTKAKGQPKPAGGALPCCPRGGASTRRVPKVVS